ncbi:MAG: ATP-binding protein [Pseudomonadota bacterium]
MPIIQETKLLHDLLNNLPHYIFWKDIDLVFRGCNKKFVEQFGYKDINEIIGKTDDDFPWTNDLRKKYTSDDKEILSTGVAKLDYEEEQIQLDGSIKTLLVSKVPLYDENNKTTGLLGIYTDISNRKKMESQLRKEQEERIRTTRIFAGGIAHELRTPLASMVNAASGIVKFMPRLVEAYNMAKEANLDVPLIRKEHLEILKDTAEHIVQGGEYSQTVITAMLVTAQTAAIDTAKFKNLFMVATIQTALTTFYYPNPDDKALVHFIAENDFQFWGDETYMMDIIYNLVKNALFFIHQAQKGEITIWLEKQKDKNIVYVKDTSAGIPKENLPRLFEGYFTTREAGTGVGLPLVRRLMQSFNGDITCESVEGEYTMFMLTFPISIDA